MTIVALPTATGDLEPYAMSGRAAFPRTAPTSTSRLAYAAAHVTIDPLRTTRLDAPVLDWEATLRFRHHLWGLGFKTAEAMDTSQRGMGLGWEQARELIDRSIREARTVPGADLACGVGTDQLAAGDHSLEAIVAAYEAQAEVVEGAGGRMILMASRALAANAEGFDDYAEVYDRLITQARDRVIIHWLGDMFDSKLAGYWGADDLDTATEHVLALIERHAAKIEGIKISLLDAGREVDIRSRLPDGVALFTGDDFNFAELIAGDDERFSHALLGIFDPIAPAAAAALQRLDAGDQEGFHAVLEPTVPLSRCIFEAPTQYYKAGVVFLAWLNGHQDHFIMAGGMEAARGIVHYAQVFRLADQAGVLDDPELAATRMRALLATHGVRP
ncbi:MAG: dihydrodipicolinate synthase family protein [Pseudomonadota bacterium]